MKDNKENEILAGNVIATVFSRRIRTRFYVEALQQFIKGNLEIDDSDPLPNPNWREDLKDEVKLFTEYIKNQPGVNPDDAVTEQDIVNYGFLYVMSHESFSVSELVKQGAVLTKAEEELSMKEFDTFMKNSDNKKLVFKKLAAIGCVFADIIMSQETKNTLTAEFNSRIDALRDLFLLNAAQGLIIKNLEPYKKALLLLNQLSDEQIGINADGQVFPMDGNEEALKQKLTSNKKSKADFPLAELIKDLKKLSGD